MDRVGERRLLHVRKKWNEDGVAPFAVLSTGADERGKSFARSVIALNRDRDLMEIVGALHTVRGFARGLDRREQQAYKDADNSNNDKKLYESKTASSYIDMFAYSNYPLFDLVRNNRDDF